MDGVGPGRRRQSEIYVRGVGGERPWIPTDASRLQEAARSVLGEEAFAYVAGGAGRESTMAANLSAFDRWRIVPRVLRDVSERDLSVELFGRRLPAPLFLCPVGVLELVHPEADLAAARAAASVGIPMAFSSQASVPMEACAEVMRSSPRWFQLYWSRSDELTASFVSRAEACGCEAILLTLDTTMLGWRPRDLDLAYLPFLEGKGIAQYTSDPVFLRQVDEEDLPPPEVEPRKNWNAIRTALAQARRHPGPVWRNLRSGIARRAVQRFVATYSRPSLRWEELPFLRDHTRLPILLKGVLHPDDARRALDLGVDGLVVSNHGGRQVDGEIAALDALPGVVEAIGDRIPVLFDSGVRGGADVVKALALGARAVGIGRPYVWALALEGEDGVRELLRNLMAELDLTLGLAGCASVEELGRGQLAEAPVEAPIRSTTAPESRRIDRSSPPTE